MAGAKFVACIGPSYHLADKKAAVQSAINCYPQRLEGDNMMLQSIPGEVQIAQLSGAVRGSRNVDGRWFVVAGSTLYEVKTSGAFTVAYSGIGDGDFVGMAHNRTQLVLVTGNNLYVYGLDGGTTTQVTVAGWLGSYDVHELDGYMVFVSPNTQQFYISAIDDSTAIDALDFSSADASPDNIVTHRVLHRQAWFFGTRSTEIWLNSGAADFPFVRYQAYTIDVGVVGRRAAINAADTLFWIGQTERGTAIVYMSVGNQPTRVSTLAVEEALRDSTDLSAAEMWCYQIEGHEFVGINAPGLTSTWVYDAALQMWHERAEWADGWAPLTGRLITAVAGGHYAGDSSGRITRLDPTANTLNGRPLVRERTWPHLKQDSMEPVIVTGLELAMTSGYGGNVTLEISRDGGKTFGPKLLRSLGATGRWMQRIRWLGLGAAFNRVFRIRCSDDVPFAIHSAAIDT